MNETEVLKVIDKVCKRSMNKYNIPGMDADDIYQESFLICAEALDRYNEKKPLENFLAFNLSRRIKNLYKKMSLKEFDYISIEELSPELLLIEHAEEVDEFILYINNKMTLYERQDYIKYIHGVPIPRVRRRKLIKKLKEYADEFENPQK